MLNIMTLNSKFWIVFNEFTYCINSVHVCKSLLRKIYWEKGKTKLHDILFIWHLNRQNEWNVFQNKAKLLQWS